MSTRKTSIEAYRAEQPLINSQLERVREIFKRYAPMRFSDADLQEITRLAKNVVWSRRAQLLRDGVIEASGVKVNAATGHMVVAYRWRQRE
jgi:DNA-binding Lrp family transcriptional regulator